MLVDTHAHIHFDQYGSDLEHVLKRAKDADVGRIITVGIDEADSLKAVELASKQTGVYASVGLHPHEAKRGSSALGQLEELACDPKVVAIGECGLDYYRNLSPKADQVSAFRFQIELALRLAKPVIFHVRDAFEDFFKIVADYPGLHGIVHSFSSDQRTCQKLLELGLLIGLNGIMTFTKDQNQLEAAKMIPLERLVLETDCPFLAPAPKRGQVNEPAHLSLIAGFLAELRDEPVAKLAAQTTTNAVDLLNLSPVP